DEVAVNTPIAVLLGEGEKPGDIKIGSPPPLASAKPKPQPERQPQSEPARAAPASAAGPIGEKVKANGSTRIFASPLAKRIAKEKGIELAAIKGSGPHGRIVLKDVEGARPGVKPMPAGAAVQPAAAAPMADEAI